MATATQNFESLPPRSLAAGEHCRIDRSPGVVDAIFESNPGHLASIRTAIESLCTETGFDEKATGEIGLVVNEAIANIIRHAYASASDRPIQARAARTANGIEIQLRDWGNGRCPAAKKKPPDPLTPGGLGLVCMHNLMDEVLFTPQPRGMLLTMRRDVSRGNGRRGGA